MKRFYLFFLSQLFLVATAFPQTGWDMRTEKADPLKGTVERVRYKWTVNERQAFAFYSVGSEWKVGVAITGLKPDPARLTKNNNFISYARVGIYDQDDNLIEAWDNIHMELTDLYKVGTSMSDSRTQRKANDKIVEHLRQGHGYVRILMDTILGNGFDIKVPCLADCQ